MQKNAWEDLGCIAHVLLTSPATLQGGDNAGYGFVDYYDHATAEMALNTLNGRKIYNHVCVPVLLMAVAVAVSVSVCTSQARF